ncbi:MAG: superoxide dismutase [Mycobacteriaceae bacterium]|nr:superoxide dismutase [Mycobacterium sp.]NBQ42853.1 superoxide dismutase [Mycobacteriaceae bacterium]
MSTPTLRAALPALPAALLVACLSACSPYEPVATTPGTTPPVWTGSAPPPALAEARGAAAEPAAAEPADTLSVQINAADGSQVAAATIEFADGVATVTVQTTSPGQLSPGMHGMHIHAVGKCEANSVAPTGGAPGDFLSAGGHFQGAGAPGHPGHGGDLSSLQVRPDGSALLVTTTSAFTKEELTAGAGTAIIIHENADNFANIPPDRYQQINGAPPPDEITLATGDAGKRVACGVIGAG